MFHGAGSLHHKIAGAARDWSEVSASRRHRKSLLNHSALNADSECYSASLKLQIANRTRNTVLGDSIDIADTSAKRRTGLLNREGLAPGEGLWIVPCESVHTFFMKFAIDLVYLGKDRKVRKVRHAMKPWRLSACLSAHSILELPAGAVAKTGTRLGDELEITKVTSR